jgi:hypothetical protein
MWRSTAITAVEARRDPSPIRLVEPPPRVIRSAKTTNRSV